MKFENAVIASMIVALAAIVVFLLVTRPAEFALSGFPWQGGVVMVLAVIGIAAATLWKNKDRR
ncbi:hypothetical protein [Gordonia amicalis]|uniref:Uncharacterized protein n=1 Tax=Gordonia amicalis TaxID=89053 RepID=A0ABU4DJJ3_9ACTN|nr:hypothetical protein [Gordonia amicalis]MDV6309893.1 hypothetical protein [Gordonia amicalis]